MPSPGNGPAPKISTGETTSSTPTPPASTSAGSRMLPLPRSTLAKALSSHSSVAPQKIALEYVSADASPASRPPIAAYSHGPPSSAHSVNTTPKPSEITTECITSDSARSWSPAPSARAMAEEMPPPMPPADIICISMTTGNTSAAPASASTPMSPT